MPCEDSVTDPAAAADAEWSIQEIAKLTGTTSRTLRHYAEIGLLAPSRIGRNGYRYYDRAGMLRLQRILLLRQLGLGLGHIAEVLDRETAEVPALESHLAWLQQEQQRLQRQIVSVRSTITTLKEAGTLMAEAMFDGFDHTQHREEIAERWGKDAYQRGDRWWRSMSAEEKSAWQQRSADLAREWVVAAENGTAPSSDQAQELARRHVQWLTSIPGTPTAAAKGSGRASADARAYVRGLGDMYVADPRFGANYATSAGSAAGAEFVRDALYVYADASMR